MNDKIKLTPEQVEEIYQLKNCYSHATSIDLENRTPDGLHLTFNFSLSSPCSYSMDVDGEYILLNKKKRGK